MIKKRLYSSKLIAIISSSITIIEKEENNDIPI